MELRCDPILFSELGNKNSDAGHIRRSHGPQIPHPCPKPCVLFCIITYSFDYVRLIDQSLQEIISFAIGNPLICETSKSDAFLSLILCHVGWKCVDTTEYRIRMTENHQRKWYRTPLGGLTDRVLCRVTCLHVFCYGLSAPLKSEMEHCILLLFLAPAYRHHRITWE